MYGFTCAHLVQAHGTTAQWLHDPQFKQQIHGVYAFKASEREGAESIPNLKKTHHTHEKILVFADSVETETEEIQGVMWNLPVTMIALYTGSDNLRSSRE